MARSQKAKNRKNPDPNPPKTDPNRFKHDQSYKRLFSHPKMVEDLLRGFVHEDWIAQLDFTTLEVFKDSFVSDNLIERHDDIIWRLNAIKLSPIIRLTSIQNLAGRCKLKGVEKFT